MQIRPIAITHNEYVGMVARKELEDKFVLTCQECGNQTTSISPNKSGNRKCSKCKSEAYDYGSMQLYNTVKGYFVTVETEDEDY